jgi:hypothetical protein
MSAYKLPNTTHHNKLTFTQQHSTEYNIEHTVNPFLHIRVRAVRAYKKPSWVTQIQISTTFHEPKPEKYRIIF